MALERLDDLRRLFLEHLRTRDAYLAYFDLPRLAAAAADDPLWIELRRVAHPTHLHPRMLLHRARSVVVWMLPFQPWVAEANAEGEVPARSWAEAYLAGNALNAELSTRLKEELAAQGEEAVRIPATHAFDPGRLVADWSHKHAAHVAGLGTLGLHRMLIAADGPCGRLGSLVCSLELEPTPRPAAPACLARAGGTCALCLRACPVDALAADGFDRARCYSRCLRNDARFDDLGTADVCGKCAAVCPARQR